MKTLSQVAVVFKKFKKENSQSAAIPQEIKNAVKKLREEQGCSVDEIASKFGCSAGTIYQWATKESRMPSMKQTKAVSHIKNKNGDEERNYLEASRAVLAKRCQEKINLMDIETITEQLNEYK